MTSGVSNWAMGYGYYIGGMGIGGDSVCTVYYGAGDGMRSYTTADTFRWSTSYQAIIQAIGKEDVLVSFNNGNNVLLARDNNGNDLWQAPDLQSPVLDEAGNI
jgi:hypothetical protein